MSIALGRTKRGRTVSLSPSDRSTHIHVLGGSGYGKSTLLEGMLLADIMAGHGLCLIDPHGTLADSVAAFCASRNIENHRRIHLIEPGKSDWCVGFNPLRLDGNTEPAARVDAMVGACAQVWGGSDLSAMPLLKKCLRAVFYALAVRELTLAEAPELMSSTGHLRHQLTKDLPDYVFDALWRDFNGLSRRDFADQFSSTSNRMIEFLSSPIVRRIVGQREHTLDLRRAMDEGDIVIVNLAEGGSISRDNARLLGTLITSELFLLAKTRTPEQARQHPFYLYIDECYDFLTSDIEAMLDQTRKFGLHICLSHQRLGQLGEPRSKIRNGVMAGAQTKIVFGGLEDDDAEEMAKQILRDQFNLERPKHSLDKLVVVDEVPFWLESESTSSGNSETSSRSTTDGWSESIGTSSNISLGTQSVEDKERVVLNESAGSGNVSNTGTSGSFTSGSSTSRTESRTLGFSQTLKPVRELQTTAVHSLEEETHRAVLRLRKLPTGTAIVRVRGKTAVQVKISREKEPIVWPKLTERFRDVVSAGSSAHSTLQAADAEMALRQTKMGLKPEPLGSEQFWQEE